LCLGVIGGLAAWGFTGMFKGAIILSVFYTLFTSWVEKKGVTPPEAGSRGGASELQGLDDSVD